MDRRILILGAFGVLFGHGCSGSATLSYPQWASSQLPVSADSASGYGAYCRAADLAEAAAGKDLAGMVNFSHDYRKILVDRMGPALKEVSKGLHAPSLGFVASTSGIGTTPKHHLGFRLLGKAMVIRIEDAVESGDFKTAAVLTTSATEFGFDLCNGNALDASLGMSIANSAREALAPALSNLSAKDLGALAKSFRALLDRRPSLTVSLENERQQMLKGVQSLQETFLAGTAPAMAKQLNLPLSATRSIKELSGKSDERRLAYFKGFADEIDLKSRYWRELVGLPLSMRDPKQNRVAKLALAEERPWRAFSDQFASLGEPLIAMNDDSLTRTRLLVLQASILSQVKSGLLAPKSITKFGDAAVDPYTGREFAYRADGREFRIYSVGPNLIDDGGQTDESGSGPDVFAEGTQ